MAALGICIFMHSQSSSSRRSFCRCQLGGGVETALWKRAVIPRTTNQMMFSSLSDIWVGKWGCCSSFFKLNYFNCMLTAKLYCTYVYIQYFSWFIKASNLDFYMILYVCT
ncbi:acireductone dioxygenase 1, isoform CRA_b [Rattus norvegicus]|uniref:Acireductone dioxygenase 1, isoform CRA_b n=1 Tax=Rattus norvegicus TaxID=10116 RepID=A6HB16_RAT|nr:acireductone dioxygenase 1, isoform CRA_b [Rattus norvegicus]